MNPVIADLLAAPEFANEASVMAARLDEMISKGALSWKRAQGMSEEITTAARAGAAVVSQVSAACQALKSAEPQVSKTVPMGF